MAEDQPGPRREQGREHLPCSAQGQPAPLVPADLAAARGGLPEVEPSDRALQPLARVEERAGGARRPLRGKQAAACGLALRGWGKGKRRRAETRAMTELWQPFEKTLPQSIGHLAGVVVIILAAGVFAERMIS